MPMIQVSADDLFKAVEQLDSGELEQFLSQVFVLWAQRQRPKLSAAEKKLLQKASRGLPNDLRQKYNDLISKRQAETLTPADQNELLRLTDQVEALQAERVQAMLDLAQKRNSSLANLMEELGICSPDHG